MSAPIHLPGPITVHIELPLPLPELAELLVDLAETFSAAGTVRASLGQLVIRLDADE